MELIDRGSCAKSIKHQIGLFRLAPRLMVHRNALKYIKVDQIQRLSWER